MLGCSILISSNQSWLHLHRLVDLMEEDQTVPDADDDQEHGGGNEGHEAEGHEAGGHEAWVHETEHGDGERDYAVKTGVAHLDQQ